jgi:hypothetical protein
MTAVINFLVRCLEIYDQPKAYSDRDIFTDWFEETFLLDLEAKHMNLNY